jgi:hypothetical protein
MNLKIQTYLRILILIAFVLVPVPGTAKTAQVEGIVLSSEGPLANFSVSAYPDFTSLADDHNGIEAEPGEKPGQFRLKLPKGSYYLVARGSLHGKNMFAYHGLNPVSINEDYRWLPFFAVESAIPAYNDGPQGIGGTVVYKGQPLAGGVASVYSISDSPFRGMGLLSNTLDESGRFWFDLEQGLYIIVARKRLGTATWGRSGGGTFSATRRQILFRFQLPNLLKLPSTVILGTISKHSLITANMIPGAEGSKIAGPLPCGTCR